MARSRPTRLQHIGGIGVHHMGSIADSFDRDFLRLANLDTDIRPDPAAVERTRLAAGEDAVNNYLRFVGQDALRDAAARHVSPLSGVAYSGTCNCVIAAGGLSGSMTPLSATGCCLGITTSSRPAPASMRNSAASEKPAAWILCP